MIEWQFILINGEDELEIDEPVGWADIGIEIVRDKRNHGISIGYALNEIKLIGEGAALVKEQYDLYGVDADVKIKITALCDDETQEEETFQLDFNRYDESCGEECDVAIGIEQQSCFSLFNNNFDKKVDMRSDVAFDGVTPLEKYGGLDQTMIIPAKALRMRDRAETTEVTENIGDPPYFDDDTDFFGHNVIVPPFQNVIESSFGSFAPSPIIDAVHWDEAAHPADPPYLDISALINTTEILGDIKCDLSTTNLSFRFKFHVDIAFNYPTELNFKAKVFRLPVGLDPSVPGNWVVEHSVSMGVLDASSETQIDIDYSASVPLTIEQGDLIYLYIHVVDSDQQIDDFTITFFAETFVNYEAIVACEETSSKVFLIHETISRVAESITNKCLQLKSEYFGRLDSAPRSYEADGCGSLEALTTGLYLRNAENPTFFLSMKDLLAGLQCIHNTGFGLEKEDEQEILRVEGMEHFYQDKLLFDCRDADVVKKKVVPEEIPGTILGGYEKWEVEKVNGLDEFNSKREYRLTIKNSKTTMDYRCKFVAGGYAVEMTRQQSFAESGAADTKYDNETFILCLERTGLYGYSYGYGYYYGDSMIVEQMNISNAANLFDPDSVINFRISPIRNMMRLAKLFFGSYRDYLGADSKIVLQSGDGNILAEGQIELDFCTPENLPIGESDDITEDKFLEPDEAQPLIRPESVTFEYPMSLADFKKIRANPYGYILHPCGGDEEKGHIMKIVYKPNAGKASLELRNRYQ